MGACGALLFHPLSREHSTTLASVQALDWPLLPDTKSYLLVHVLVVPSNYSYEKGVFRVYYYRATASNVAEMQS